MLLSGVVDGVVMIVLLCYCIVLVFLWSLAAHDSVMV